MKVEKYAAWLAESGCRSVHLLSIEQPEDLAPGIAYLADQLADSQRNAAQAVARVGELEGEREEMLGLLNDVERGGACFTSAEQPDSQADDCEGEYSMDGDRLGDTCWEHRRRALVARLTTSAREPE